jgi:hypothetical protein
MTNNCPTCKDELTTLAGAPYCLSCGKVVAVKVAPKVEAKPAKARCPHAQIIRQFAATAREMGLSMADKDRARGAMGVYLGVKIQSRSELTAGQWNSAITGLKAGVLFW